MNTKAFIKYLEKNPKEAKRLKKLSKEKAGLTRYLAYLQSPWKILYTNFIAGIAYGFGFLIGAAVVVSLMGIVVQNFLSQIPLVGDSIELFYNWLQQQIKLYKTVK